MKTDGWLCSPSQVGMEEETDELLDHEDSLIIVDIEKDTVSSFV